MRSRILFVTGHQEDARHLSQMLHTLPIAVDHAGTVHQARAELQQTDYEVVLTEAALPDGNGLDMLHFARENPRTPEVQRAPEVIVTDPHADARLWSEVLNLGAYDLLAQPFYEPEVRRILYNACSRQPCQTAGAAM